jgi:hypothetical protein
MDRFFWAAVVPVATAAAASALALACCLVPASVPPKTELFLARYKSHCAPEPREQLCYVLAITIVPLVFWLGAAYAHRQARKANGPASAGAWPGLVRWTLAITVLGMLFYQEVCLEPYLGAGVLGIGLAVTALMGLLWPAVGWGWKERLNGLQRAIFRYGDARPWHRWMPIFLALVMTVLELLPGVYLQNMPDVGFVYECHTPVQLGDFAAVLGGRTPLVDYLPQYQTVLTYALAPVFERTGLTISTFSLAMCALSALALLTIYCIFLAVTRNSWYALLLYLPFLLASFVPMNDAGMAYHQRISAFTYYAVWPLRYLGPTLTAGVLAWYLARPGAARRFLLFLTAALAALNNLDFGLPALGGALIAVLLTAGVGPLPGSRAIRQILSSFMLAAGLAVLAFVLLTYGRSGRLPQVDMFTFYQRVFVLNGFNMLPMPALGLHVIIYLTFMAAIGRGLFGNPEHRLVNGLLLYFGVFGCGAMMYYVGRSHHLVLISVFSPWACAFLLLAYALGRAILERKEPVGVLHFLHAPALLLGLGLLLCVWQIRSFPNPVHQVARLQMRGAKPWPDIDRIVEFVRAHAACGENVIITYPYGHLIAYEAKVNNVFPFAQGESLILRAQVDRVMEAMGHHGVMRVFGVFEPELADALTRQGFRPSICVESFSLWERRVARGGTPSGTPVLRRACRNATEVASCSRQDTRCSGDTADLNAEDKPK